MRRDPVIIGGGPAGCAAAITLARTGARTGCVPMLLERSVGPMDKVCGDFLSVDTIQRARALGVDPAGLGGAPIDRVRLIRGDQTAEAALPFPALGLSRRTLDAALLRQAEAAGVRVRSGQSVRRLGRVDGGWIVQADSAISASAVFLATGKHDLRDSPRRHTQRDAIGMKMYFALAAGPGRTLEGATELTLFPGGYAGMQSVEDGKAVLCIAVQRAAFQTYGGGWSGLLAAIAESCPRFAAMLSGSRALLARPLAVAGVPYGYRASGGELFRVGDQAAVIASLAGDGMAIAMDSGRLAAEAWLAGVEAAVYQRRMARALAPQMRVAGLLHWGGLSRPAQSIAVPVVRLFPGLLRHAARRTRVPDGAAFSLVI